MDIEPINDVSENIENANYDENVVLDPIVADAEIPNFDKVENYYSLKNAYDENKKTHKNRSFLDLGENDVANWKLKKTLLNQTKPKCVNCKRNVGTIFSNNFNAENKNRILIAKCGDINAPCELNIELSLNPVYLLDEQVRQNKKDLTSNQDVIIRTKNDLLFGYLPEEEALKIFENVTVDIEENTKNMEINLYKFLNITHNTKEYEKIKELKTQFYENIREFKGFITNFEKDKNAKHIQNANEYYEHNILPTIKELNELKYAYTNVDHDVENKTKHLIQKEYTINMIENLNGKEMVDVIHYTIGSVEQEQVQETIMEPEPSVPSLEPPSKKVRKPQTTVRANPLEPDAQKTKKNRPQINRPQINQQKEQLASENVRIFKAIDELKQIIPQDEFEQMTLRQLVEKLESEYGFKDLLITHKNDIKNYVLGLQSTKPKRTKKPVGQTPKIIVPEQIDNATIFKAIDEMRTKIPPQELGALSLKQFIERLENEYGFSNLLLTHKKIIKNYLVAPEFEVEP